MSCRSLSLAVPHPTKTAVHDPRLEARIVARSQLLYAEGSSDDDDRPPYVASASGLATLGEFLFVVQDNANWVAIVHPDESVSSIPLPRGPGGVRVFNDERDNTDEKADLEACVIMECDGGPELVAFGSGTGDARCWILRVSGIERAGEGGKCKSEFLDARHFYRSLNENRLFSGGHVNIEGAIALDDQRILLLQRGDAKPDQGEAVDALGVVEWGDLEAHLEQPERIPPPALSDVVRYELGDLGGTRLTFSDAERIGRDRFLYSASAEDPDSGNVAGSVLGLIDQSGDARWTIVVDEQGKPFTGKIEGLTVSPGKLDRIRFVIDDDDETAPSEIFEAELSPEFGVR